MSLMYVHLEEQMFEAAKRIYDFQLEQDKSLSAELNDEKMRSMLQDIYYNLDFLDTAVHFDDVRVFAKYAVWLYELLVHLPNASNWS